MKTSLFCLILPFFIACNGGSDQQTSNQVDNGKSLLQGNNSNAFNQSFEQLLGAYLQLSDQLAAEKDSGIAIAGRALILTSDSLKLNELKADSNLIQTAYAYSDGISSEAQGLLGENNLLSKRRSFQMISDQLFDLIRTVQYNQKTLYHAFCDKAFEDQGAYWITDKPITSNPYQPSIKPICGEIRDTLRFIVN